MTRFTAGPAGKEMIMDSPNLLLDSDRAKVLIEDHLVHGISEHRSGPPSVECRMQGTIELDGTEYRFDYVVRARCKAAGANP